MRRYRVRSYRSRHPQASARAHSLAHLRAQSVVAARARRLIQRGHKWFQTLTAELTFELFCRIKIWKVAYADTVRKVSLSRCIQGIYKHIGIFPAQFHGVIARSGFSPERG